MLDQSDVSPGIAMKLLERETPLRKLDAALQGAIAGEGRVALVSGEAGIGKTSLVEQFVLEQRGSVRVLWGTCDSLFTPRPLGPLHDMAMQSKGELLALLNADADRQAIFSTSFAELQNRPTIAVFEDVHWADEATLDLIKFLSRRIRQTSSLVILTYRADELGVGHPLWLLLGDLPSAATLRVHLLPLSEPSVTALASVAGQAERANELFEITSGNPFFVTEILAGEGEGMPATIRDAVLARAVRLSPTARAVLEAAAVIGTRVEPWLLSSIVGAESAHVEECIAGGMLQSQDDHYAFRHELARQTILETIFPERRLALHRMALVALKESRLTRNDLARLANHAVGTKDASAVLEYAPAAARQASAASSHREAISFYELALRFADKLPLNEHARILEAFEFELFFANRGFERMTVLQKAIELRHSIGDRLREGVNLKNLSEAYFEVGRKADAEQASHSAIKILEALPPSPELAKAYQAQCFMRMLTRDYAEAFTWGEKAIALAERFNDTETVARSYNYMGCAMLILDYERGLELMQRSLAIGRKANLPFTIAGTLTNLGWMSVEVYQPIDALRYLDEGIPYATEHDDHYHLHLMQAYRALSRFYQGYWIEAIAIAKPVLQSPYQDNETRTYAFLALGRPYVRSGDPNAWVALDEALALSAETHEIQRLGVARAAKAEASWLAGDDDRAIKEARSAYDMAVSKAHPWITGELAFWRWRAGDDFSPPEWIANPFALQIAGDWREAAEAWEQRGCPYEQAMALMDGDEAGQLAALEIFERLGAQPAAEKLKLKLRAQGMRGIPRGPRPTTRENPFSLTAREMEVLGCLVAGSSNPVIAKKLSLSTRTVEHHIASILQKMQVQSRHEAVVLALNDHLFSPE
jgi:DNA-binding CsgD family transcriptional regulator/tetratricopeptide (TPR) repeat protein